MEMIIAFIVFCFPKVASKTPYTVSAGLMFLTLCYWRGAEQHTIWSGKFLTVCNGLFTRYKGKRWLYSVFASKSSINSLFHIILRSSFSLTLFTQPCDILWLSAPCASNKPVYRIFLFFCGVPPTARKGPPRNKLLPASPSLLDWCYRQLYRS